MAPRLVVDWPPPALWPLVKLGALLGLAYVSGLALHIAFTGGTFLGEILSGCILGPRVWDIVPHTEMLILLGNLAKFIMVFERGLQVNPALLLKVGGPAIGLYMVLMGFTMLFVGIALRMDGFSLIESSAGGAALSTLAIGVVDVGWARRDMEDLVPRSESASQLLACTGTVGSFIALMVLSIMQGLGPGWSWWDPLQAFLFSVAILSGCVVLAQVWRIICCPQLERVFGVPQSGTESMFDGFDVVMVVFMLGFAVAMAIVSDLVKASPVLGVLVAGLCFSGVQDARKIWEYRTENVSPWLLRIFYICAVGFLLPEEMWTIEKSFYTGLKVAAASLGGRFLSAMLLGWPFLLAQPRGKESLLQVACGVLIQGELGFVMVVELVTYGVMDKELLAPTMWGLMISAQLAPLLYQLSLHFSQAFESEQEEERAPVAGDTIEMSMSKEPLMGGVPWSPAGVDPRNGYGASPAVTMMPPVQDVNSTLAQGNRDLNNTASSASPPHTRTVNFSTYDAPILQYTPGGQAMALRNSMQPSYYTAINSPSTPPVKATPPPQQAYFSPAQVRQDQQAVQARSAALHTALQAAAGNPPPAAANPPPEAVPRQLSVQTHIRRQYPALWADTT